MLTLIFISCKWKFHIFIFILHQKCVHVQWTLSLSAFMHHNLNSNTSFLQEVKKEVANEWVISVESWNTDQTRSTDQKILNKSSHMPAFLFVTPWWCYFWQSQRVGHKGYSSWWAHNFQKDIKARQRVEPIIPQNLSILKHSTVEKKNIFSKVYYILKTNSHCSGATLEQWQF